MHHISLNIMLWAQSVLQLYSVLLDIHTCVHHLPLCRGHTVKASASHMASGGKEWDTVKPLHKWFRHVDRVLLMDDDAYKVPDDKAGFVSFEKCFRLDQACTHRACWLLQADACMSTLHITANAHFTTA